MPGTTNIRLNKVLRELNISLDRAVEFLASKGHEIEARKAGYVVARRDFEVRTGETTEIVFGLNPVEDTLE